MRQAKSRTPRLAKLTPPILPPVIERARLFRQLDRAMKSPLTWIAAPPGAGKTTLLASYLKKRRRLSLWYRLDAGDIDPSTFFHYLGLAVQTASPRFRKQLPHLTPEYFAGLPIFTQRFFEQLGTRIHRPTMLVFDNYHEVAAESLLHQLLPVGIQRLPPHIRVVVLSRELYPQGYIQLAAERQLQSMRPEELELTRAEAAQVYRLQVTRRKLPTNSKAIDQCWEVVGGWMAGFILLLERGERNVSGEMAARADPQAVFEYLAGEVMTHLPADVQEVLTTMSLVGDFTPEMAVALTGRPEAERILDQLYRGRYFIERRADRIGWFRYHPLFRDFLQRRARQKFDTEALRRLCESASAFLISADLEADAADLLEAAGAWESYRVLIQRCGPTLIRQGRVQTLEAWIRRLPEAERTADPWMDLWLAPCRNVVASGEAIRLYESAFIRFRERGEQEPMLLAWAGAVHSIIFTYSRMKQLQAWLQVFDEIHPPGSSFPSLEVEALVVDALTIGYVYIAPYRADARRWLDRSEALREHLPEHMSPFSRYCAQQIHIWFDDFATLQVLFTESKETAERPGASPLTRLLHHVFTAELGWLTGDVEQCRRAVEEGMAVCESSGLLAFSSVIIPQIIYNELLLGNVDVARSHLERMKPIAISMGGLHVTHYWMLSSWADLIEGRADQAWAKCQKGREILDAEGCPVFADALHRLIEAQILAERGQRQEAEQLLTRTESVGQAMPSMSLTTGVYFVRAQWAFEDGNAEQGSLWLRRVLEDGQKSPQIGFVGWVPQEAARLFEKALELGIEVPYVLEAIRKRQLKPPSDGSAPENWPWRVKIRTFGKLTVEVDSKPLEKHRKAPHRLLELLAAIIAFGGHDVPVSRLVDALWPEADGDTAQENFKKSIARLRKLLSIDDVIQWKDGKISLNRNLCWVDALVFEKQAKQGDAQAIAVYKGPFLGPGDIPAWAVSPRDRMQARFISLVKQRDNLQADTDQSKNAALVSQKTVTRTLESKSAARSNG